MTWHSKLEGRTRENGSSNDGVPCAWPKARTMANVEGKGGKKWTGLRAAGNKMEEEGLEGAGGERRERKRRMQTKRGGEKERRKGVRMIEKRKETRSADEVRRVGSRR